MKERPRYKITFLDRLGPDGMRYVAAWKYAAAVFVLSAVMFTFLGGSKIGLTGFPLASFTLVCALTLSCLCVIVAIRLGDGAGWGATHVYLGGASTPYQESFSLEQALVMQRDYAGAAFLFEQRIVAAPTDIRVLIAAADLYFGEADNPKRAAELYRMVQRVEGLLIGQDVYVSNRLADLYLGKLAEPGKALVEFRRLMHRYPDSAAGKNAKLALDNLKPDLVKPPEQL